MERFLLLAYFGTDQSQVQRYLTGKSIGQSRLSLLFNAMAKVPMQFFILFIGAMVFVFFLFDKTAAAVPSGAKWSRSKQTPEYPAHRMRGTTQAFEQRRVAARRYQGCARCACRAAAAYEFRAAQKDLDGARADALKLSAENDTNYIFLSFVTHYLPRGHRRAGAGGDLHGSHVVDFGRNQFARHRDRDRYLQAPLPNRTRPIVIT